MKHSEWFSQYVKFRWIWFGVFHWLVTKERTIDVNFTLRCPVMGRIPTHFLKLPCTNGILRSLSGLPPL